MADDLETFCVPVCPGCKEPLERFKVQKQNRNHGRYFFSCSEHDMFVWEDEIDTESGWEWHPSTPNTSTLRSYGITSQAEVMTSANHPGIVFLTASSPVVLKLRAIPDNQDQFGIENKFDQKFINHIKTLPYAQREWNPQLHMWVFPWGSYQQVIDHLEHGQFLISEPCKRRLERALNLQPVPPALPEPHTPASPAPSRGQRRARSQLTAGDSTARALFREDDEQGVQHSPAGEAGPSQSKCAQSQPGSRRQGKGKEPHEEEQDDNTCVVCMDRKRTHALVPCGHARYCKDCSDTLLARGRCPECRKGVTQVIKLYL